MQSVLNAAGLEAQAIATMTWIMFAGAALVMLLVLGILFYVLFRDPDRRASVSAAGLIFSGGVALPVVTLTALLIYTLGASAELRAVQGDPAARVDIIGHRWWWEVRYAAEDSHQGFTTANELHLPVGRATQLRVLSADVIHSLWIPVLAGKIDLLPGRWNEIVLEPSRPGAWRGQCAEFCGAQHARMALDVVTHPPGEFAAWRRRQAGAAADPADALAARGRDVFMTGGCALCHRVRGTGAQGTFGPDLTHVGSRRTIAAGTLPATRGSFAAWIVQAQHIKRGNRMPSFNAFSGQDLRALAAYMESLK